MIARPDALQSDAAFLLAVSVQPDGDKTRKGKADGFSPGHNWKSTQMEGKIPISTSPAVSGRGKKEAALASNIFDQVLRFPGERPEFAALLLAAAFTSKMIRNGVIFTWNGSEQPPTIQSTLPKLPDETLPGWMEPVLSHLAGGATPLHVHVFPPVNVTGGARQSRGELLVPLSPAENAYAAFEMSDIQPAAMSALMHNMEFFSSLWRFYELRQRGDLGDALAPAMAVLSSVNQTDRFQKFAMSLCNEMSSRFGCDRVSLGFVKSRYTRVAAMSHTEKFGKGMNLIRAIEVAMEECVDQDAETVFPEPPGFTGVSRGAGELARQFGSGSVIVLPLRHDDETMAAICLEKATANSPDAREMKVLRLVGELVAPRLIELRQHDRWFGARLWGWFTRRMKSLLGPTHTLAKLASLACLAAAIWLAVAKGEYRVVAAPFDGFVHAVHVRPGEALEQDKTLMVELETSELRSLLAMRRAEQRSYEKDAALARRDNKLAESQVAEAKVEQADAECRLLEEKIRHAKIYAPLDGVTLSGDWTKKIGAPVKQGDPLFEVAPINDMEADLYIPEEDISDIKVGQEGELAAAGRPDAKVRFRVVRITPMAELVKQKNVFRVQAKLVNPPEWLRPGIEGVAKVDVDERLLIEIWTRRALNWVRMKLWW